jgi:tRNA threonylcarbamoyladenosine biosynthesis protein TsaB
MRILAIDCSTEWLSVAVRDGEVLRERREHALQAHSQRVLPLVQEVLDEAALALDAVDGIAFGAGPGSFTGVRIACGVAQGLALGLSRPVVAVSTLEALAEDACERHGAESVLACLDARMHEVYVAACERRGGRWHQASAAQVVKPAELAVPVGHWFGAGNGFAAYPTLTRLVAAGSDATLIPTAGAVARLASARFAAGEGVAAEDALPHYVRHRVALTSAERAVGAVL